MASQLYILVSILLHFSVVTGQVIARNVVREEVSEDAVSVPPSRQVVSVKINGTFFELDLGVCTGGVMMKRRVPVEEFCGVGVFTTRPSGCSSDKERFIGVDDRYTCSRLMSGVQGFLRVVVEDEFTTTEGVVSSTEDGITSPTDVAGSSTDAVTINVVEINSEGVTIETAPYINEEVTIEAAASTTEMAIDLPETTVVTSTTTEKTTTSERVTSSETITTSEGTTTFIEKNLDLDQPPMNDTAFEHNSLIEKRGVKIDAFTEDLGEMESTTVELELASLAKDGGESTTAMTDTAETTEDDFAVEFEVVKKKQVVGKRESGKGGKHGISEEDTLPLEEPSVGLAGRSDGGDAPPGMPYDVKPVGFKTVAAPPKLKQKVKVDEEGNEEAVEDGNEGSEEDTLPIVDDGVEIPGVDAMLAGRAGELRGDMGVEQVGFGLKVEVVDWSSEKDELGGPWMSGEDESLEEGLGVVDARGWGIEEWIEMPPPSPLFDAHSTLLRKQIDFELLKGGKHGDGGSGGSSGSSGFSPHVSVVSEKEIQFNSTWYQILSEIAATASVLIPVELFRDPFSGSECDSGDECAVGGSREARQSHNAAREDGKENSTAGGGGKPNNTFGTGGGSEGGSESVIPKLPIFADLLRVFGWFTRSYESSVVVGERVLEGIKNGFKECREAAEIWRQGIVLGEIGGCDAGVEIKSIKVGQPVWNEYNASYTTMERLLNFTSSSTDLPPMELRINSGKWIFSELLWYAVQLTYTFCFESFSESDPNGFMMAYDVILRLFGSEMVKGLWEEVGGNLAVFELVLPFVRRSLGGGDFTRVVTELDKISGGIRAGGYVNGFGRGRRRWEEERGGRSRNSWDESGRVLRRRKRDVGGENEELKLRRQGASLVKVVEKGEVDGTTESVGSVSSVDEAMSSTSTARSKLWLNIAAVSTLGSTTTEDTPTSTEVSRSTTILNSKTKGRVFDQAGGWFVNRLLDNKTAEENGEEKVGDGGMSSTTVLTEDKEETTTSLPTKTSVPVATKEETETTLVPTSTTVQPIELVEVETEETVVTTTPIIQETQDDDLRKYEIWGGFAYCLVSEEGEEGMSMMRPSVGEMVEKGGLVC